MTATAWIERAACRGLDAELFYPARGESTAAARAVCDTCPVAGECTALASYEKFGVWAGASERARRGQRHALELEHGTRERFEAGCHCGPCRVADTARPSPLPSERPPCPECGGPVPPPSNPERPTLFCSWRCGDKARRRLYDSARPRPAQPEERTVTVTSITPEPEHGGRRPPPIIRSKDCRQCGRPFSPTSNGSKYCSMDCSGKAAAARQSGGPPKDDERAPATAPAPARPTRPDGLDILRQIVGVAAVAEITIVTTDGIEIIVRAR